MTVFISGGVKSGKSSLAQRCALRLAGGGKRYYVATMLPSDEEDRARIRRHVADRAGMGFVTLEVPRRAEDCLSLGDHGGTFLVDSVTALLLNEMVPENHAGDADLDAAKRCVEGLLKVAKGAGNAVFVSDYIYSDAIQYDDFTERYRANLAFIDRALAAACDTVLELCAGCVTVHKGVWEG